MASNAVRQTPTASPSLYRLSPLFKKGTQMTSPVVLLERPADGVALIRINRPDARNALNMEVRRLIAQHMTELGDDQATRCIVLTGNEKSFAAGADIKEM